MSKNQKRVKNKKTDILLPLAAYVLLVAFKIIFVINNREVPNLSDEFNYIEYARQIFDRGWYNAVHYPLFYPLVLSPSFLFGDNFYVVMKIINVLWSSTVPVLVYFIARQFVGRKESVIALAFSMILPFHYTYPMIILSENVYFPLMLLGVLVLVCDIRHKWVEAIAFGALIGVMFMTRHVTLVMIPVWGMAWLLKRLADKDNIFIILMQGVSLVAAGVLSYMPYFIMQLNNGYKIKGIIGFSIASNPNPEQLTFRRLLMVALFYICFLSVVCAPMLGVMIKSVLAIEWKNILGKYNRIWFLIWGLLGVNLIAVVRHSWRTDYNYPVFERIKGRYLLYFPMLFMLLSIIVIFDRKYKIKNNIANIFLTYIVPVFMVVVSYGIIAKGWIFNLNGEVFLGSIEAIDGIRALKAGYKYVIIVLVLAMAAQIFVDYGKETAQKAAVVGLCLVLAGFTGNTEGWNRIQELHESDKTSFVGLSKKIAYMNESIETDNSDKTWVYTDVAHAYRFIREFVRYDSMAKISYTNDSTKIMDDEVYVFTKKPKKYKKYLIDEIHKFTHKGVDYYLLYVRSEALTAIN